MTIEISPTQTLSVLAERKPSRVGVIVKPNQPDAIKTLCELAGWLTARGITLVGISNRERAQVEAATGCMIETHAPEDLATNVDAVIVLGGDGTMIATARLLGEREIPVLGINYGTLGYLAEFRTDEMHAALEALITGKYKIDRRMMLDAELYRGEKMKTKSRVLNDVVIGKSALSRIIEIEARCDGRFVNRFRADGLIVSTPTGSTAYNLSAGGPIIYPSMNAVVLTPICPHTLSNRPLVVSGDVEIELILHTAREEVALTSDGQMSVPLEAGDRVTVCKSQTTFNLMQPDSRNYFEVLRGKLSWGK